MIRADQYGFDACGAELNTKSGPPVFNEVFRFASHLGILPSLALPPEIVPL